MNTSRLETTDIFRGAFFLCMGGALSGVKFRRSGRKNASFLFTGSDLHRHDLDYMNGQARVNPLQFREALNHLRDILFENLRKNEGRYEHAEQSEYPLRQRRTSITRNQQGTHKSHQERR